MSTQKAVEKVNTKEVNIYMVSGKVLSYHLTPDKMREIRDTMAEGKPIIIIGARMINVTNIEYVDMIN